MSYSTVVKLRKEKAKKVVRVFMLAFLTPKAIAFIYFSKIRCIELPENTFRAEPDKLSPSTALTLYSIYPLIYSKKWFSCLKTKIKFTICVCFLSTRDPCLRPNNNKVSSMRI